MNATISATTTDPATDNDNDRVRAWLQGQIKGCLQRSGVQEWLYPIIENALYEQSEIETRTDEQSDSVRHALDHLRETDRQLSWGEWEEARLSMLTAHNALKRAGAAMETGAGWRRELDLQLNDIDESIEYAICEPGSLDWTTWQGPEGCSILTRQPYYQEQQLDQVLDMWEDGVVVKIVDGCLTAEIDDDDDDQD